MVSSIVRPAKTQKKPILENCLSYIPVTSRGTIGSGQFGGGIGGGSFVRFGALYLARSLFGFMGGMGGGTSGRSASPELRDAEHRRAR